MSQDDLNNGGIHATPWGVEDKRINTRQVSFQKIGDIPSLEITAAGESVLHGIDQSLIDRALMQLKPRHG